MTDESVWIDGGRLVSSQGAEHAITRELEWVAKERGKIHPATIVKTVSLGKLLNQRGKHDDEENLYQRTLQAMVERYGRAHLATFWALGRLALVISRRGRHSEVECLLSPNLEPIQNKLGVDHPLALSTAILHSLSRRKTGESGEFDRIKPKTMESRYATLDDEHRLLMECMVHAAESIGEQGKLEEAEELLLHVKETLENAAVERNASILLFINDVGLWFGQQGKHEYAEQIHRRALKHIEEIFGDVNSFALGTLSMIVEALVKQQKFREAQRMQEYKIERAEKLLGVNRLAVSESLHRMGWLLGLQAKYAEEEQFQRRAADIMENIHGPRDARTLIARRAVAMAILNQGRVEDAEWLHRETLQSQLAVLGDSHPDTIQSLDDVAAALSRLGKYDEAKYFYQWAFDRNVQLRGQNDPSTLHLMNRMAETLSYQGLYTRAVDMHYQTHWLMVEVHGEEHVATVSNLNDLLETFLRDEQYENAEALAHRLVGVFQNTVGKLHIWTLELLVTLGFAMSLQSRYEDGVAILRRAITEVTRIRGEDSPTVIQGVFNLGVTMLKHGELTEAENAFRQAAELQERTLGLCHITTLDTKALLATITYKQERQKEVETMPGAAANGLGSVLGDNHPFSAHQLKRRAMILKDLGFEKEAEQARRQAFDMVLQIIESYEAPELGITNRICAKCADASASPPSEYILHHKDMDELAYSAKTCPLCKDIFQSVVEECQDEEYDVYDIPGLVVTPYRSMGTNYEQLDEFGIYGRTVCSVVGEHEFDVLNFHARIFGPENEMTARAIYKKGLPPGTLVGERLHLIQSWLHECQENHTKCSPSEYGNLDKPTRLVDLGCPQDGQDPRPRLVDVAELDGSVTVEYTALSYCWGTQPCDAAMTTHGNLSSQHQKIELASLPRTYRDAMVVTVTLGIRFIWIDSLCIVQQDHDEWSAEAANMSSIYQNSVVVLAAASAADMNGGLSLDSWRQPKLYHYLSQQGEEVPVEIWHYKSTRNRRTPLHTRGWTLQETLLARRIVYFSDDQVAWQCQTHTNTEDGTVRESTQYRLQHDVLANPLDFSNRWSPCHHWWSWVKNYTSRELTDASDYMAAIAGITQYFSQRVNVLPALGLWADYMFAFGLGWSLTDIIGLHAVSNPGLSPPPTPRRSVLRHMPSWSWFRYQEPIYCALFADHGIACTLVVRIKLVWAGKEHTSDLVFSQLLLKGPVKTLKLFPQPTLERGQFCSFTEPHLACVIDDGVSSVERDENGYIRAPCLLLTMQTRSRFATFMVMQEMRSRKRRGRKTYRRIGVGAFGCVAGSLHPFLNADDETIKLV